MKSEYRSLPFVARCGRWWRYMPIRYALASWESVKWACRGCQPQMIDLRETDDDPPDTYVRSRWDTLRAIWFRSIIRGEFAMGDSRPFGEFVKEKCR